MLINRERFSSFLKRIRKFGSYIGIDPQDAADTDERDSAQPVAGRPRLPVRPTRDKAIRYGVIACIVGLGGFTLWGTLVPLSEGVVAFGSVVVANRHKRVQHLEGGIVGALHVREGADVVKGNLLIELDTTRDQAELDRLEAREWSVRAQIARLEAEKLMQEDVAFPVQLLELKRDVPRVADILQGQKEFFDEQRHRLLGQLEILGHRIEQLRKRIDGLEIQRGALERESDLLAREINTLTVLYEQQIEDEITLLARRREKERMVGEIGVITSDIAATEVQIGEAQQQRLQLENDYRTQAAEELTQAQDLLFETTERLAQIRDIIARSKIIAPTSGTVIGLTVHTVGGVIPSGEPVMNIVPQDDLLVVEAQVRTNDIDSIRGDQEARLRMTALKLRTTPVLLGKVTRISADAFTNQERGESYYTVQAEVPETELEKLQGEAILPGMPVEVMFEGRKRTAFSYLSEPLMNIIRRSLREE